MGNTYLTPAPQPIYNKYQDLGLIIDAVLVPKNSTEIKYSASFTGLEWARNLVICINTDATGSVATMTPYIKRTITSVTPNIVVETALTPPTTTANTWIYNMQSTGGLLTESVQFGFKNTNVTTDATISVRAWLYF